MKRTLKIIIACGSGCCTSTLCKNIISELAQSEKIPAEVSTWQFHGTASHVSKL